MDRLDATFGLLIHEYLNSNRTFQQVALLTMKMNERCLANEALENMRPEIIAGE
jgi:hypothetical protein